MKNLTYCTSSSCDRKHVCLRSVYHRNFRPNPDHRLQDYWERGLWDCGRWLPEGLDA